MRRSALIHVAIVAVLLSACTTDDSTPVPSPDPSALNPLAGTSWNLVEYSSGPDSEPTAVPASVSATAAFTATQTSGVDGCNNFSGGYSVDGDQIRFDAIASTQKACTGAADEVAAVFLTVLGSAQTFNMADEKLTILGEGGNGAEATLTFTAADPTALAGTSWTATGINNGKQAVTSLAPDTTVTALFSDDGTVSGNASCNSYNGPFTVNGSELSIAELATTKKLCEDAVNAQETAYLNALKASTTFTIRGNTLELRDDDDALQVTYKAQ